MLQQEGYATRRRSDAEAAERDPNQRLSQRLQDAEPGRQPELDKRPT